VFRQPSLCSFCLRYNADPPPHRSPGVLAAPVAAVTVSTEARAQAQAVAFLRVHAAPQQDELAELRAVNPNAYAIVKALLTKRSLGLLDPKHPSASFASHAAPIDDATPSGPEAFKAIAQESGEKSAVAVPYEAAPVASEHHDWLNWKPQQSAVDDEAMVNSVLGAVAQIKGGQNLRGAAVNSDSEAATEESAESTPPPPPPSTTPEAHDAPKPAGENSYLKGLDLTVDDSEAKTPGQETITPEAATPATEKEAPANPPKKDNAQGDALAGFSFDDDQKDDQKPAQAATEAPVVTPKAKNTLFAWLDGKLGKTESAPKPQVQKSDAVVPSYMDYLK